MQTDTILRTGVTRGLRPIAMPLPPQSTGWVASLRKRPVTYSELDAIKRLEIVQPLLLKLRKRPGRTSLLATLDLLGLGKVDLDDVAEIVASGPNTSHLSRVRSGDVDDIRLWEDVKDVARMRSQGGHGPEDAVPRLARALGVLEALLSVPEGRRAAVVAGEMA